MGYLFTRCRGKRTVLIAPNEILTSIALNETNGRVLRRFEITRKQLDTRLKNLVLDGYIDYSLTDKNGEQIYVVSLTTRGEAFQREHDERLKTGIRSFGVKILYAVVGAIVTIIVTIIWHKIWR